MFEIEVEASDSWQEGGYFPRVPGEGAQRIVIKVPGIEDFATVESLLRRAGAKITRSRRTFAVEGDITVTQAAALMELAIFQDDNTEGQRLAISFESLPSEPLHVPGAWWAAQQAAQRTM